MLRPRSIDRPHCEFVTPAELDREVRAAGFSTAVHRGVLFGPMVGPNQLMGPFVIDSSQRRSRSCVDSEKDQVACLDLSRWAGI